MFHEKSIIIVVLNSPFLLIQAPGNLFDHFGWLNHHFLTIFDGETTISNYVCCLNSLCFTTYHSEHPHFWPVKCLEKSPGTPRKRRRSARLKDQAIAFRHALRGLEFHGEKSLWKMMISPSKIVKNGWFTLNTVENCGFLQIKLTKKYSKFTMNNVDLTDE